MSLQVTQTEDLNQAMSQAVHQAHAIDEKANQHAMNQERIAWNTQTLFRQTQQIQEERDKYWSAQLQSEKNRWYLNEERAVSCRNREEVRFEKRRVICSCCLVGALAVAIIALLAHSLFKKE